MLCDSCCKQCEEEPRHACTSDQEEHGSYKEGDHRDDLEFGHYQQW